MWFGLKTLKSLLFEGVSLEPAIPGYGKHFLTAQSAESVTFRACCDKREFTGFSKTAHNQVKPSHVKRVATSASFRATKKPVLRAENS